MFKFSSGGLQGRPRRVRETCERWRGEGGAYGSRTILWATAVGGALMLVSGCATTHTHSVQSICQAAGGTYAQGTCQPGSPTSGRQICEKLNARWVEALGMCEFEGGKK
jgi:hypothetical protein